MSGTKSLVGLLVLAGMLAGVAPAEDGARYLVIAADQFTGIVAPLAEWKTAKGMLAKVVSATAAGGGNNAEAIRSYIRTAHTTWPIPPEYVLIVGSPDYVRSPSDYYDGRFGDLSGDYKMEIPVGRLPAMNARECTLLVAKTIAYENPPWTDTTWFIKGTTTVREDGDEDDSIYWNDSRILHGHMQASGFSRIDSMSMQRGQGSNDVNIAAAEGRGFLTYRGQGVRYWWNPFNAITPGTWNNGNRMPVVVGGTCATVTLAPGETGQGFYGDEFVRAGTVAGLGGAIAYFGTTRSGSNVARPRSNCYRGFFRALFAYGNPRLGDATLEGKASTQSDQIRYEEWNLMGDPELNVWTAMPGHLSVSYDSAIIMTPQDFRVTVTSGGSPVQGAIVCVWMDSVVYKHGATGATGEAVLSIDPSHIGTMRVTVTGRNRLPFQGNCAVTPGGVPYLVVEALHVGDYQGNGDGVINPGERFRLEVGLHNLGSVTATGVQARLRTAETALTLHDSTSAYGTVLPDSTAWGDGFELAVDTTVVEGTALACELEVIDAGGDTWTRPIQLLVRAARIDVAAVLLLDSAPGGNANGRLGAGESGRLRVALANTGGGRLDACRARLAVYDTNCVLLDSTAWYGWLNPGDTLPGTYDMFAVTAGMGLPPNSSVRFALQLVGTGGSYNYRREVEFELATEAATGGPTGPDPYGYWCYDNTDTASGRAPVFQWQDIRTIGTWIDSVSTRDAATVQRALPFAFNYYGQAYNEISICSNGFLAAGRQTYTNGYNRALPDTGAAAAMICPFWDDLNPSDQGYGDAWLYSDTATHRFIVQFSEFAHYGQANIRETFQVIFHDPAYYPTPTGDGDIVMMYNQVQNNSSCTVGIEDHTETRGICYLYNNIYAAGASWLQTGRALRFTTLPPVSAERPWLVAEEYHVTDSLGNNNGLFEAGETLAVTVLVRNRGALPANGTNGVLRTLDVDATVLDSAAHLGDIPAGGQAVNTTPFTFAVAPLPGDSLLSFELRLAADGYTTTAYFSIGLTDVTGIASKPEGPTVTGLERVSPNPAHGRAVIQYALARPGWVELALYDAAGRVVRTLASGFAPAGRHALAVPTGELAGGVYFCRLSVHDERGAELSTRKLQVVR